MAAALELTLAAMLAGNFCRAWDGGRSASTSAKARRRCTARRTAATSAPRRSCSSPAPTWPRRATATPPRRSTSPPRPVRPPEPAAH
eukprot:scaffold680_cov309-Prasinococcus_capsulatus_cf.AAC.4